MDVKQQQILEKKNIDEKQKGQKKQQSNNNIQKCEFYVERKRRTCKFQAVKGSKFCAAHCSDQENKVQCPYEKGMFIDQSKLQRHLLICPKIKNKKVYEESQWFTKGVNLNQQENQLKAPHFNAVGQIDSGLLTKVINKLVGFFIKSFGENALSYVWSTEQQKIQDLTNDHTQAHLLAQAAFKAGLIRDDIIYIEFGAGKGILSYHIAQRVKKQCNKMSKNILLQRQTRKNKFDRFMKDNPYFQRFKSDVSDFDVSKLPMTMAETAFLKKPNIDIKVEAAQLNQLQIVGVCKHMCGGALDISVRALLKTKMSGCILASCCHHLCSYDSYLNNKFFQQYGFTPDEIQIIFKISAWGTKSSTVKKEQINFQQLQKIEHTNLHSNTKVIIGRMCKRLIDLGRAQILKCSLLRYCSDQITPQNFVIISQ